MRIIFGLLLLFFIKASKAFGVLDSFKATLFSPSSNGALLQQRAELKQKLLRKCEQNSREEIEEIIAELAKVSPTPESANSPLLQKTWLLEWTTEKEINFFIDWNLCDDITQTISGLTLGNRIPFKNGGFLSVDGQLSKEEGGVRTSFKFSDATLDLGFLGPFSIPPVGEGWFDTVYLDAELRVDTNSRDDILICTPFER